ncbi:MAG: FAD-dependent oxidoreductase [Caldilineaceae bacterium]
MGMNSAENGIFDLIIIGGGPAGLAAATTALNAGLHVALVTPDLGGKVSYPFELREQPPVDSVWGADLVHQFERYVAGHLEDHFVTTVQNVSKLHNGHFQVDLSGDDGPIHGRTVLVATGAKPQRLHIPGEQELWMRGLSYSALSHAPFFEGRDALVVGRGERALVAALQLAILARRVYLAPTLVLQESPMVAQIRQNPRITLFEGWKLQRIIGTDFVEQAELVQSYTTKVLDVDGVFIELGLIPTQEFVRELVKFDPETGRIPINQRCETNIPGLFAAGDVTNIFAEQVPVAIGEGAKAALSAWEYLAIQYSAQERPVQMTPHIGRRLLQRGS